LDEQGWRSEHDLGREREAPQRRAATEPAVTTELLGDVLGHHELVRVVGSGPSGLVYEAFDPRLGRRVAIKTFRLDGLEPEAAANFEQRLRAGTRAAAALQHPNVVAVSDCDRHGPTASLAMEFIEGENLAQHLARVGKLPALQALALVAQLLSALEAAHAHGLVHGRIEPEQLLVSRTGQLKVTGFGVPQPAGSDIRGDLFSAAVIAYHLLTGALPLPRPDAGAPVAPHVLRPDLPPALDGVFERALAKDPASRYQSADEFFAALRTAFDPPLWERPEKVAAVVDQPRDLAPVVAPAAPVARQAKAHRSRPVRHGLRTRFAVAGACVAAVATVAALLLAGEFGPPLTRRGAPDAVPSTTAPVSSLAAPPAPAIEAPAPPPVAIAEAPNPVVTTMNVPAPAISPPSVPAPAALPEAVPPRREPDSERTTLRPSTRLAADTRVAGAGPARHQTVVARRQAALLERQQQRGGPDAMCRHQQLAIAREICRVAQCATAELRAHPVCVRMHAEQRQRDQIAEQASRTR
jgi:serine/threonine-protein kinase